MPNIIPTSTVTAQWGVQVRKRDYQERYASYWQSTASLTRSGRAVDAVLMPLAPSASVEPGKGRYLGYTGVGNVLDYSAAVVPVGKVDKEVDGRYEYLPISEMDREVWESCELETSSFPEVCEAIWQRVQWGTIEMLLLTN